MVTLHELLNDSPPSPVMWCSLLTASCWLPSQWYSLHRCDPATKRKQTTWNPRQLLITDPKTHIYIQSSPTLLNLEFKKLFNGLIAVNGILIILRAYRPPAVPLHRAVVVFHHPGMIQQLSNSKTSLGVHLQDTKGIYTSVDNRRHISLYTRHQLAAPEHPRVHGVICLHVRVREMSLKLLN